MAGKIKSTKNTETSRRKIEFSKLFCLMAFIFFVVIGCWMIWQYYELVQMAIINSSAIVPDAALPIAGITFILAPLISYLTYQGSLKRSRNRYGVDENGQPFKMEVDDG